MPAVAKLALWLGSVAAIAALVQLVAWLAGTPFNITQPEYGGRSVLIVIGLVTLLVMMQLDRRSIADYGLAVGDNWAAQARAGMMLGFGTAVIWYAVMHRAAVVELNGRVPSAGDWLEAALMALTAIPVAALQQVIFSGYFLSMLRQQFRAPLAIILSSAAFAGISQLGQSEMFSAERLPMVTGLFLIALLLGTLRVRMGNIVLPTFLLAGWIAARRFARELDVFHPIATTEAAKWLGPNADMRLAPAVWGLLILATAAAAWVLWRRGEQPLPQNAPALSANFKKVFPFSNVLALTPLDLWIRRLAEARFRVGFQYLPRLAWSLAASTVNTLLTLPERLLAPLLVKHRVPDGVCIVGVHRSGTTHLHNLLALDPQFVAPRNFHVFNPHGMLGCGWPTNLLMGMFMTMKRPMDGMKNHLFSPQEEEFAMAATGAPSPYWGACFPREIARHDRHIYPARQTDAERRAWRRQMLLFLRKLTFWSRRRPLLKSPYNTARVAELKGLMPGGKFIHIVRHPERVYRSNMHLAEQGWVVWQLQDPREDDNYRTRFLGHYRQIEETYYRDAAVLPPGDTAELKFEDLERDPIGEIRRLYAELGLEYTLAFDARLKRYLAGVADYKKNSFSQLPAEERSAVRAAMGGFYAQWGYDQGETPMAA